MKQSKLILQVILAFISIPSISQTDSSKRINPTNITIQGENERYWAQEIFDKTYSPHLFEMYKGTIMLVNETTLRYNESIIITHFIEKNIGQFLKKVFFIRQFSPGTKMGEF
jgi:hypothetical protein